MAVESESIWPISSTLFPTKYVSAVFAHNDANLPQRIVLGQEEATRPTYTWHGLERRDGPISVFQYTLSGRGVLERKGIRHILTPGQAFIVDIPDDHRYYLPAGWAPWNFIFLCFNGEDMLRHVRRIIETHGPIFTLPAHHPVAKCYLDLIPAVISGNVNDVETFAELLYRFVLALRRTAECANHPTSTAINHALQFSAQHFADNIGVNEMAQAAGFSRAHFCRQFRLQTRTSPLEHLQQLRLQHAASLLRSTALSLDDIATFCGFTSASYLGKVFRKTYAISPTAFRRR